MISPTATPLSMVVGPNTWPSQDPAAIARLNPFWNMAGQPSTSRAAQDSRALQQTLKASTAPSQVPGLAADLASQFMLGLVLLLLVLAHR